MSPAGGPGGSVVRRGLVTATGPLLWAAATGVLVAIAATGQRVTDKPMVDELSLIVSFGAFVAVGGVVTWRQPGNAVGWLLSAVGVLASGVFLATAFASIELRDDPSSLAGWFAAWWAEMTWLPMVALAVVFLPLVFPDGRLLGPRWRWVGIACGVALVTGSVAVGLAPTTYVGEAGFGFAVDNPLAATGIAPALETVLTVSTGTIVVTVLLALASLAVRYRRADPTTRRQIGWVLYATATTVLLASVADAVPAVPAALLTATALTAIPGAILLAVTRYRLYEIDRLVNRTLVYVTLTAVSVAIYAFGTVALQTVLRPLTGGSDLAVAGSTLAVAGAFSPLRRRIQTTVDRRFDRVRYDAGRTVADFASRLRDELDLDEVDRELRAVVVGTLQVGGSSLWLRGRAPGDRPTAGRSAAHRAVGGR